MNSTISILLCIFFLFATTLNASAIKILIVDDVFETIPKQDEPLKKMGKLQGDLLVNGNHYSGNIEVWKGSTGLYLINELPLEDYVKHVVAAEIGSNWEMEAIKAQAVISRTYALHKILNKNSRKYDVTSSVLHQVYNGSRVNSRIAYAVMSTEGETLFFKGQIIESFYHSTCGGRTEIPEEVFGKAYPYLKSVYSKCELSPYANWRRVFSLNDFERALNTKTISLITIASYTSTKRVKTILVKSATGEHNILATDLRKILGWKQLPSTNFEIYLRPNEVIFEGRGYGHGIGLCQWSALEMAKDGMGYKDILAHFYPGTGIKIYHENM